MAQESKPGDWAPDSSLPTAGGGAFRLAEALGKTLVLYFIHEFG